MSSAPFITAVLDGDAVFSDIDGYVDAWHDGSSDLKLHEFLGISWEEYQLWVEKPSSIRLIIAAHERDESVFELAAEPDEYALAARGLNAEETKAVREWLIQTKRLPRN